MFPYKFRRKTTKKNHSTFQYMNHDKWDSTRLQHPTFHCCGILGASCHHVAVLGIVALTEENFTWHRDGALVETHGSKDDRAELVQT